MKKLMIRDIALLGVIVACIPSDFVQAVGNWVPSFGPEDPGSAMYTLEDVWNRLSAGALGEKRSGAFLPPQSGPADGGKSLDDIMSVAPEMDNVSGAQPNDVEEGKTYWSLRTDSTWGLQAGTRSLPPAEVPKSGQTSSYLAGDDGAWQSGASWLGPDPRFSVNGNGTVTDNLTGLIWLQEANCFGAQTWDVAMLMARGLNHGECGLTDGSVEGDWRLPTAQELSSLVDYGQYNPALPADVNVVFPEGVADYYWTSTGYTPSLGNDSWIVNFTTGALEPREKDAWPPSCGVWPVRVLPSQ